MLSMYSIIRRLESAQMGLLSEIQCKISEQIKVPRPQYLALEELTMGTPPTFKTSIGTFKPDRQEELLMPALETLKLKHKVMVHRDKRKRSNLVVSNMCNNTFNSNRNKPQKWLRLTLWLIKLKNTKMEAHPETRTIKRVRISKINFAQKEVILRTLIITLLVNVSAKEHTL